MELFRDPVIANDGRVYEREAITKWINEHGTSPFTRQPLQVSELQPDDYLRQLAARHRNSVVSYNAQPSTVTLPPLRTGSRNANRIYPQGTTNATAAGPANASCSKSCICIFIFCGVIVLAITLTIVIVLVQSGSSKATGNGYSYSTSTPPNIILNASTNFSAALTTMSSTYAAPTGSPIPSNNHYYIVRKIFVNIYGYYVIRSNSFIDLYGYLYRDPFDATRPTVNLLMQNDDSGGRGQFLMQGLLSSSLYNLVVTTYSPNVTGPFSISVGGPEPVIIQ
ncbi:unnamed protein product [Adineta steineri]|uniref:U-box domain-containing protein n=1 Tax=Adineta steineri TaxID=433720 RepID=A0A815L2U4_9BILA|nr:unnamed protein product [Adineta steineri]CAF3885198.1 unnamed protein product [Adineta steineri]